MLHIKRTAVRKGTTKSTFIDARARAARPNHDVRIHALATDVPARCKARAVSLGTNAGKAKRRPTDEHRHRANTKALIYKAEAAGVRGRGSPRISEPDGSPPGDKQSQWYHGLITALPWSDHDTIATALPFKCRCL